ncbi:MAG: F-box protein, partial [Candidatus Berkiella sp.]
YDKLNDTLKLFRNSPPHYLSIYEIEEMKSIITESENVARLLFHVVRREDELIKKMLEKNIKLLFKRGSVIDHAGRSFQNITGFEYMLWALDKHGWTMMIECIENDQNREELFKQLLAQYNKVEIEGVTYTLNGKKITESHFDFQNTIIKALKVHKDLCNTPTPDENAIDKQWIEDVGGAQKLFPKHVVFEYCSEEPFYSISKFNAKPKLSMEFFNCINQTNELWYSSDSKLGVDFAVLKPEQRAIGVTGCARLLSFSMLKGPSISS